MNEKEVEDGHMKRLEFFGPWQTLNTNNLILK